MALVKLDAEEAMFARSKVRKWPSIAGTGNENLRPITRAYYNPRIKIEKGDTVFTMGSCFARQLEDTGPKWLGLKKTSHFNSRSQNKYNLHSVLNQIRWAYGTDDIEKSFSGILPYSPDTYTDFHGHTMVTEDPREERDESLWSTQGTEAEQIASRGRVNGIFEKMKDANFMVITLGMAEVWYDRETELVLNETPAAYTLAKFPKRFEFQQIDFNEIMDCFDEIYDIFSANNGPDFKLLLTVSPIPYTSTFSPNGGAITGNCYSKSVQRAAVETFMARHDNVGYFPSYEMAIHSDNQYVWDHDFIHVTADFAAYLMAYAQNALLSEELLEEHPEISPNLVDLRMVDLLQEMGLKEMIKPYLKYNPVKDKEFAKIKEEYDDQFQTLKVQVIEETQKMILEKDQMIADLMRDRDRIADEKNTLFMEKLKLEMGEV